MTQNLEKRPKKWPKSRKMTQNLEKSKKTVKEINLNRIKNDCRKKSLQIGGIKNLKKPYQLGGGKKNDPKKRIN